MAKKKDVREQLRQVTGLPRAWHDSIASQTPREDLELNRGTEAV